MIIIARLSAEQGALVMKTIELAADRQDAPDDTPDDAPDDAPVGARPDGRHDDEENTDNDPDVTAEKSAHANGDFSYIEDGPDVTAETCRRIACDCSKVEIIEDENRRKNQLRCRMPNVNRCDR